MKVGTLFGEYPFEYRRVERRPEGVAVVGLVAGIEASVVLTSDDVIAAGKKLVPLIAVGAALALLRHRQRG